MSAPPQRHGTQGTVVDTAVAATNPAYYAHDASSDQHRYYYATPHQLYPYMSIFYANVQQQQQPQQPAQQQAVDFEQHMAQCWTERNKLEQTQAQAPSQSATFDGDDQEHGYWELPKPEYGPLASNSHRCSEQKPRVGSAYQAVIPARTLHHESHENEKKTDTKHTIEFEDHCVWECNKITASQLDEYLKIVQFVLGTGRYTDCHYDEQKALYLLKLHNYNAWDAISTLTFRKPDKKNPNFAWMSKPQSAATDQVAANHTNVIRNEAGDDEEDDGDDNGEDEDDDGDERYAYRYNGGMSMMSNMSQNTAAADTAPASDNDADESYDDDDNCFACGDGGNLLICDAEDCTRVWHIHCAHLTSMPPEEERWFCPSHECCVCKQPQPQPQQQVGGPLSASEKQFMCAYCGNAYCARHVPSACTRYKYRRVEFLCETCLSQQPDAQDMDNGDTAVFEFAAEKFMARLYELHKRRKSYLKRHKCDHELALQQYAQEFEDAENGMRKLPIPIRCVLGEDRLQVEWFTLYAAVIIMGGLAKLTALNDWDAVRTSCGLDAGFQSETAWRNLRDAYIQYLYIYERQYYALCQHKLPPSIQNVVDRMRALQGLFDNNV